MFWLFVSMMRGLRRFNATNEVQRMRTEFLLLGFLAVSHGVVAGELEPLDPHLWPLTAHMQRAQRVEVKEVKTMADDQTSVVARLTFADGAALTCRYTMRTRAVRSGGGAGVHVQPVSEECGSSLRAQ